MASFNGFDNTAFLSGDNRIDSLLIGFDWNARVGQSANVTYAFRGTPSAQFVSDFNYALQTWSHIANINFTQVSSSASPKITAVEDSTLLAQGELGETDPSFTGSQLVNAVVRVDPNDPDRPAAHPDADIVLTMIHEIGHALGLKHPENYGGDADGLAPFLPSGLANNDVTVMAYADGTHSTEANPAQTPMAYDILAMQYLYGANTTMQNIALNITGALTTQTVWSGGGFNQFNATSFGGNGVYDLRQGGLNMAGQSNYFIAYGTHVQQLLAGVGNDSITANGDGDLISAAMGNDMITGGSGSDTLWGGKGNDIIHVGSGSANVNGNIGNDTITGGNGGDLIHGGQNNDQITGGTGNDTFYGDLGDDRLTGNGGANLFVFNNFSGPSGNDVISDFHSGIDKIEFNSAIFASAAAALAAVDSSGVIHLHDGSTITLSGVAQSQLAASDFLIVG